MNHLLQIHEPGETPAPHSGETPNAIAVGIDLGTTHSVVAFVSEGKPTVLHDMCGGTLVPSIVQYLPDGEVRVGKAAKSAQIAGEAGVNLSIKRYMAAANQRFAQPDGKARTPVEISADILRHLKRLAERALNADVTQAVITVPAYFDDTARQATRDAAQLAGLEVLRLINEPTAAALAYGLDSAAEGVYAMVDLGGGTFDVSLLKLERGVFQVLATAGDTALGGDDCDHALLELAGLAVNGPNLAAARAAKEALSAQEQVTLAGHTITRTAFETAIAPLMARLTAIIQRAMDDADLSVQDVKGVVLVGGATRVPLVQRRVAEYFDQTPLADVNPDEVVAVGAAHQAAALTQGSDTLLLDVTPLSLGIETMGGIVEKIIHRNTPIPAHVKQEFTTYADGQTAMVIHILQGERETVETCRSLATFTLSGIPPMVAGLARIEVGFAIDVDGLLTVTAREQTTGTAQTIEVKPTYGLELEEMGRMLRESMEHAREDITERLLREARVEAERTIAELQSALRNAQDRALLLPGEEDGFAIAVETLQQALNTSDRDAIDLATQALARITRPFAERRMDAAIRQALEGVAVSQALASSGG